MSTSPAPAHTPRAPRKVWTPEDIATLRQHYGDTDTTELAQRLGRHPHHLQLKASRLGLARDPDRPKHHVGRPAHTRHAVLQALETFGAAGAMRHQLVAALPQQSADATAHGLYNALLQDLAFVLRLGRYSRYYATKAWRDAAAASMAATHPAGAPMPGTLRERIHTLTLQAAHQGRSLDELDSAMPGVTRARIHIANNRMLEVGLLHSHGTGPNKRLFASTHWAEAYAHTQQIVARVAASKAQAPAPATPTATTAPAARSASAEKRRLLAAAKRGAALPGARQIELATQRARAKGRLPTDTPWTEPREAQPEPTIRPEGLQVQVIESKACYRHQLMASNDAGAGFAAAGIGRYVEPVSSWVEAVAERRAA